MPNERGPLGENRPKAWEGEERENKHQGVKDDAPLAIVGIGASAGGLEALEKFFWNMPADNGMAFVVIQHMDPAQPSLLPEILQRFTKMRVEAIEEENILARPNTVYVKPPDFDLSILHGRFSLLTPMAKVGGRMSIDLFFRHLAEDQKRKAVGIILSGMGSDGTLGIRALKEHTGMVMAQEPASSGFDAMPQNAIATDLVDYVAPPEDLPQLLMDYVEASSQLQVKHLPVTPAAESALAKIFILIRSRTGKDFSMYKRSTVMRRIERRMGLHQLTRLDDYVRYLQEQPQEVEILGKEMLIGVTQFFRDPEAWETFKDKALPKLIETKPVGGTLRVWVVGCSTGEEAYTMAIVLTESLEALRRSGDLKFQIFATDVENESIDVARVGVYPPNIEADVSIQRLERFFVKEDGKYRVSKQIREKVLFALQDVIRDPPFTHLDILSCRNLLIYLTPELQDKLITLFHFALEPEGMLFLGEAESAGKDDLFAPLDRAWKIFQRRYTSSSEAAFLEFPFVFEPPSAAHGARRLPELRESPIVAIAQARLLDKYAPPAIIVTKDGDILYIHGRTGKYLEPSPGKANLNVISMAREGLRYSVVSALRTAAAENREVSDKEVFVQTDSGSKKISLTVQPIHRSGSLSDLFLVAFEDWPEPQIPPTEPKEELKEEEGPEDAKLSEMNKELRDTRAELQHMIEEKQASQEELMSMNEELQSANEELQSTNEELTSSKEELQSINEEIQTMNAELQSKIEALTQSHDDMRNLLQSADIPMAFLDSDLKVRRFTDAIKPIINLRGNDIGRPISELKLNLLNVDFVRDAQEVLDTLQLKEKRVQTEDGRWFQMRLMPYRTSDNKINGVTVTFVDITEIEETEQFLRNLVDSIIAASREPLLVLDSEMRVVLANQSYFKAFEVTAKDTTGKLLYTLGNRQWDVPRLRLLLEEVLPKNSSIEDFEVKQNFPKIGERTMLLNARKIQSDMGPGLILLGIEDITDRQAGTKSESQNAGKDVAS